MNRAWMLLALAVPLIGHGAVTNWNDAATHLDIIEARREGRPAPQPRPAPGTRIVGRRDGKVLVETRYPLGGVTTNARTLHVIYNAVAVATNTHAQTAYSAALGRYVRALAKSLDADCDADSKDAAALHRQADRLNREADKLAPKNYAHRPGRGQDAGLLAGVAAACVAAAYGFRKWATA